jgi:FMN phosphatase YigB (HAD superfamily)
MTKRIEDVTTIGFDIDHTIYIPSINRDIPRYFCQKIAQELKCDENEIIEFYNHQNQNGNNSPQTIKKFCKDKLNHRRIDEIFLDVLEEHEVIDQSQNNPELVEFFNKLKEKYKLFIVTGNRKAHAIKKLNALGLNISLFNRSIYNPDDKTRGLQLISKILITPFNKMIYIGDSETQDITPANSLGLYTVKICPNPNTPTKADLRIDNPLKLQDLLL